MDGALIISDLRATVEDKLILNGVDMHVRAGEIHAVMGPNGSGKSTLAYALMGHPSYRISSQKSLIKIGKKNIVSLSSEERAKEGLFLAFQSPIAIPGVHVMNLLRVAYQEIHEQGSSLVTKSSGVHNPVFGKLSTNGEVDLLAFRKTVKEYAQMLRIDDAFLSRGIHDGFSGGEKKKMEMLQALVLAPKYAIFDEIDTGLDVDALRVVASGIDRLVKNGTGVIIITHYQRILKYLRPDRVHILVNGKIVKTGKASLAKEIESHGYKHYTT
ncbi:Fe-S cluster assembly ATPase SufC [Candidatus Gottesmanbacteria bacterium]|nr:Fe-S cluster assembly ATPase SufC [Candidatus Gottesmanbacteria bacterium]